jgi:hypothetical protein
MRNLKTSFTAAALSLFAACSDDARPHTFDDKPDKVDFCGNIRPFPTDVYCPWFHYYAYTGASETLALKDCDPVKAFQVAAAALASERPGFAEPSSHFNVVCQDYVGDIECTGDLVHTLNDIICATPAEIEAVISECENSEEPGTVCAAIHDCIANQGLVQINSLDYAGCVE